MPLQFRPYPSLIGAPGGGYASGGYEPDDAATQAAQQFRYQKQLQDARNQTDLLGALTGSQASQANARTAADAGVRQSQISADTNRFQTQTEADTTRSGNQLAADTTRHGQDLSFQASLAPVQLARDKFNSVFPLFQSAIGGGGQPQGAFQGQVSPIGPTSVYTPEQTQAQQNAAYAHNAGLAATQQQQVRQRAASQGASSRSPLVQALTAAAQGQRMQADSDAGRQIAYEAAKGNADQATQAYTLGTQRYLGDQTSFVNQQNAQLQYRASLLAALAGLS